MRGNCPSGCAISTRECHFWPIRRQVRGIRQTGHSSSPALRLVPSNGNWLCTPSSCAPLAYGLSGFFTGHSSHVGIFQGAAFSMAVVHRQSCVRSTATGLDLCRLTGGCLILAGHFQTALYCSFGLGCFMMARAGPGWRQIGRAAIVPRHRRDTILHRAIRRHGKLHGSARYYAVLFFTADSCSFHWR